MPFIGSVRGNFGPQGRLGEFLPLLFSTGGTITTDSTWRYHTFTGAGSYTFTASSAGDVEVLVVAGGGSGHNGNVAGSGGGGGVVFRGQYAVSAGVTSVTVGAGGATAGIAGGNSTFGTLTALGGGAGVQEGLTTGIPATANNGGSGSGGGYSPGANDYTVGSSGTPGNATQPGSASGGFGYKGGRGARQNLDHNTGGGGGAGTPGADGYYQLLRGGRGGTGRPFNTSGTKTYYAGGGGGATWISGVLAENGGRGGGGRGGYNGSSATDSGVAGTPNTGGGGGAESNGSSNPGGSGIVIVRYPLKPTYWSGGTGSSSTSPAFSAQAILAANPSATDGVYWIRPKGYNGSAFQVHCAFNSGNAWMRVAYEAIGVGGGLVNLEADSNEANLSTNALSSSGIIGSRFSQSAGHYSTIRLQWDTTRLTTFTQGTFMQFDVDFEVFENNFLTGTGQNELSTTTTQPGSSNWNNRWVANYSTNSSLTYGTSGATFARLSNGNGIGDAGIHGAGTGIDTLWAVKDRRDMRYALGCNNGGWTSDYSMVTYPGGSYTGGGFTGVSASGVAKNGITSNNVMFWIK